MRWNRVIGPMTKLAELPTAVSRSPCLRGKSASVLLACALLSVGLSACGGSEGAYRSASHDTTPTDTSSEPVATSTTTSVIPPGQRLRGDGDADNPNDIDGNGDSDAASVGGADGDSDNPTTESYRFPDKDDKAIFAYGHAPSVATKRAISQVAKRYYAAAAAENGVVACSMLLPVLARSVPEDDGGFAGPIYLRGGKTCQAVLSMLFRHFHRQLAETITVVRVRVEGSDARVIFSSRTMPASSIALVRADGSWRVPTLIGQPLP